MDLFLLGLSCTLIKWKLWQAQITILHKPLLPYSLLFYWVNVLANKWNLKYQSSLTTFFPLVWYPLIFYIHYEKAQIVIQSDYIFSCYCAWNWYGAAGGIQLSSRKYIYILHSYFLVGLLFMPICKNFLKSFAICFTVNLTSCNLAYHSQFSSVCANSTYQK